MGTTAGETCCQSFCVHDHIWAVLDRHGYHSKIGLFKKTAGAIVVFGFIFAGLALTSFSILRASFFWDAQLSGITVTIVVLILGT
jgi:hypothetical protein